MKNTRSGVTFGYAGCEMVTYACKTTNPVGIASNNLNSLARNFAAPVFF